MFKKEKKRLMTVCMLAKEDLQGAWLKNRRNRIIMLVSAAVIAAIFALPTERFMVLLRVNP